MMFIKQLAYFGDLLSFYTDNQLLETFQDYAQLSFNVINNARMMGYKPRLSGGALLLPSSGLPKS